MNVCCCGSRLIAAVQPLCENCVTECCAVVMSTAFAMDVPPVSDNNFSYLQTKWRPPKAGVTGSTNREAIDQAAPQAQVNPVGVAPETDW
jgi:hypothetical protein